MVARFIEAFITAVLRRPGRWTLIGLAIMACGAGLATRIRIADDARALVADADPEAHRQLDALSEFTAVDNLLLHVHGHGHPEQLEPAARVLATELGGQTDAFESVRFETQATEQLGLVAALMPRRFLLDPRPPEEILAEPALSQRLLEVRETLLAPHGLIQKPFLLRDPLGSMPIALSALSAAPGLSKLDATSGRFMSKDGQSLLVIASPKGNPFGGNDAARTMARVAAAEQLARKVSPNVSVSAIGAHRFTHDAESMIKSDVHFSVVWSLLGVLIIFIAFFRKPVLALAAIPPLAFGACVAAGVAGALQMPVHGIVLAFSAACLGLAIDNTIHVVSTVASCGSDPRQALPMAARRIGPSLGLVMTTTVAGLLALCISRVAALRQMGILSMAAVFGAFVGTLLWVPIILPRIAKTTPVPPLMRGPWTWAVHFARRRPVAVVVVACCLAVVLGYVARNTRVDGDLRNLDTHTDSGQADEAAFAEAFGDPGSSALVLVESKSLDEGLENTEHIASGLRQRGVLRVLSLTSLAPPRAIAEARRARWCDPNAKWADKLVAAGVVQGFRDAAFAGFVAELKSMCASQHGDGETALEALLDPTPAISAFEKLLHRPVLRHGADGSVRLAVAFEASGATMTEAKKFIGGTAGATLINRSELNDKLMGVVAGDMPRLGFLSFFLVLALLALSFRDISHPLRALAPCILALLTLFGAFAAFDIPMNLMNLVVFPLLAGVGIDYGVLMAYADKDPDPETTDERAFSLTVAAATTIADFGTMASARYYALSTIGVSVLLAVGSAAVYALFLSPALAAIAQSRQRRRQGEVESAKVTIA